MIAYLYSLGNILSIVVLNRRRKLQQLNWEFTAFGIQYRENFLSIYVSNNKDDRTNILKREVETPPCYYLRKQYKRNARHDFVCNLNSRLFVDDS